MDMAEFKVWVEREDKRQPRDTSKRKSAKEATLKNAGKGKARVKPTAIDSEDEVEDVDGHDKPTIDGNFGNKDRVKQTPATRLLDAVGLTKSEFLCQVISVRASMKDFPFTELHRKTPHYRTRVITTGGLTWNPVSQNFKRDYAPVAIATVLECATVHTYRAKFLNTKACRGACVLRGILLEKLMEKSKSVVRENSLTGKNEIIQHWEFPDRLEVTLELDAPEVIDLDADAVTLPVNPSSQPSGSSLTRPIKPRAYDAESMLQVRLAPKAIGPEKEKKDKRSIVEQFVHTLEKNRWLLSQEPGVPQGTIESLANIAISILALVRLPSHSTLAPRIADRPSLYPDVLALLQHDRPAPHASFSLHPPQIMVINIARVAHDNEDWSDDPEGNAEFDPSSVVIPALKRRTHAVTNAFHKIVSSLLSLDFAHGKTYSLSPLAWLWHIGNYRVRPRRLRGYGEPTFVHSPCQSNSQSYTQMFDPADKPLTNETGENALREAKKTGKHHGLHPIDRVIPCAPCMPHHISWQLRNPRTISSVYVRSHSDHDTVQLRVTHPFPFFFQGHLRPPLRDGSKPRRRTDTSANPLQPKASILPPSRTGSRTGFFPFARKFSRADGGGNGEDSGDGEGGEEDEPNDEGDGDGKSKGGDEGDDGDDDSGQSKGERQSRDLPTPSQSRATGITPTPDDPRSSPSPESRSLGCASFSSLPLPFEATLTSLSTSFVPLYQPKPTTIVCTVSCPDT